MKIILKCSFILSILGFHAQTFTSNQIAPINDVSVNSFVLQVDNLPSNLNQVNFGLESVCINIEHSYINDLIIKLFAPDGSSFDLVSNFGGGTGFYTNTCFSSNSIDEIANSQTPYTGNFKPFGQMGIVNNGQNGNGQWTLEIEDNAAVDEGQILSWSITFGNSPAALFTILDSDLPIVMIETGGQSIPDEPKINGNVKIIFEGENQRNFINTSSFHFAGNCGIETRGASSSSFPKKSYDLEIRDLIGNDLDTSILGFPRESDWVLSAQYTDKTLLRNMFSMHLIQEMGWYAPRFRPVELFVDNQYMGVYIFMEKVKRGVDRVDVSKLDTNEITGDNLTGGYILKLDKNSGSSNLGWTSPYAPIPAGSEIVIDYYYPKGDVIANEQKNYIEDYFTEFEQVLASPNFDDADLGYRKYMNYGSCLDGLIISELSKNIDAYRKSFYIYKDKESKGGKLVMAPIWDYDLTYGNADFCQGESPEGWQYNFNYVCGGDYWINPFWFPRFMEDAKFQQDLRCRWKDLRTTKLHEDSLNLWIDQMAAKLNESQTWNYTVWPTMGTYVWPNSFVGQNYNEDVNFMKTWLAQRIAWLDENIPGDPANCSNANLEVQQVNKIEIYPNPVDEYFFVKLKTKEGLKSIQLKDISGKSISRFDYEGMNIKDEVKINLKDLKLISGTYFIEISFEDQITTKKVQKK